MSKCIAGGKPFNPLPPEGLAEVLERHESKHEDRSEAGRSRSVHERWSAAGKKDVAGRRRDASPDEPAVSIEYEGPCKPWKKDRRPQATLRLKEVTEELVRAPP